MSNSLSPFAGVASLIMASVPLLAVIAAVSTRLIG